MWKLCSIVVLGGALGLTGCAQEAWAPNPGVAMGSFPAAMAQCQKEAAQLPATALGAANPLYVAGAQEDFMNRCMAAAGWHRG